MPFNNYLYAGIAFVVILLLLLIFQSMSRVKKIQSDLKSYQVSVETEKGMVKIDNKQLAGNLRSLHKQLHGKKSFARQQCKDLTPLIQSSINNLKEYIAANPDGGNALCSIDLKADIVNQSIVDLVDPEIEHQNKAFNTILDWEKHERDISIDPVERVEYLINNLDIVIRLLNNNVCTFGKIDISKLQKILEELNKEACKGKASIEYDIDPNATYTRIHNPWTRTLQNERGKPHDSIYANHIYNVESFAGNSGMIENELQPKHQATLADLGSIKGTFMDSEKHAYKPDDSLEGTVEKDILGYMPPGHIMSVLSEKDRSMHQTTRVGSCGGKTIPDEHFFAQCVGDDLSFRSALDGDSSKMLNCDGDCNTRNNYDNFYKKMYAENPTAYAELNLGYYSDQ